MKINASHTNFMVSIRSCKWFLRCGARFVCFVKYHFFKIFQNSFQRGKFPLKPFSQVKINVPDTNFIVSIPSCKWFLRYGARFVCFVKYHFFKTFQNSSQRGKFPLKTILTSENQCPRHKFHCFDSMLQAVFEIWSSFRLFR